MEPKKEKILYSFLWILWLHLLSLNYNQTEVAIVKLVLSKYVKSFEILRKVDQLSEIVRIGKVLMSSLE